MRIANALQPPGIAKLGKPSEYVPTPTFGTDGARKRLANLSD